MGNGNSIAFAQTYTERTLIESILSSYYILDYGFIKAVNTDETIDVTHAKQLKTYDNQSLKATVTTGVEVLTLCGGGFSFKFDYKKGDKVLLLGLKNYIPKVNDVTQATETTAYLHYTRETMKAIPLCVFNGDAKVKVQVEEGTLTIECEKDVIVKSENAQVECEKNVTVKADKVIADCSSLTVKKGQGANALEVTP